MTRTKNRRTTTTFRRSIRSYCTQTPGRCASTDPSQRVRSQRRWRRDYARRRAGHAGHNHPDNFTHGWTSPSISGGRSAGRHAERGAWQHDPRQQETRRPSAWSAWRQVDGGKSACTVDAYTNRTAAWPQGWLCVQCGQRLRSGQCIAPRCGRHRRMRVCRRHGRPRHHPRHGAGHVYAARRDRNFVWLERGSGVRRGAVRARRGREFRPRVQHHLSQRRRLRLHLQVGRRDGAEQRLLAEWTAAERR